MVADLSYNIYSRLISIIHTFMYVYMYVLFSKCSKHMDPGNNQKTFISSDLHKLRR